MSDIIVEVKQGKLRGSKIRTQLLQKECYSFTGVPYAKPPVGELRFKAPQAPESWHGERDATVQVPPCPQMDKDTGAMIGSEDCLYLNIFTPKIDKKELLPVMFFIHGGGFVYGNMADNGPDFLLEQGVVTIAVQYRLGIYGFLNLDMPDAQGNMGLKDQVQALRWVKENIAAFGGDPNNVTIFGFSAGGASVEYLTLSPMAKGLFHKAIAQSGSSLNPWASNRHNDRTIENVSQCLGIKFNSKKELYEMFSKMSSEQLLKAGTSIMVKRPAWAKAGLYFGFVPSIEKKIEGFESFLTENTLDLLKRGEFTKVPYMTGLSRREGLLMYYTMGHKAEELLEKKNFIEELPFELNNADQDKYANKLKEVYLDNLPPNDFKDSSAINFYTDVDFLGGVSTAIKHISKYNSPSYLYEFAYDGGYNFLKLKCNLMQHPGACHGDDGGYLSTSPILPKQGSKIDDLVRARMVEMWTNFAKFGNPTPKKSETLPIIWPSLGVGSAPYLVIDSDLSINENMEQKRTALYEELYEKYWN